MTIYHRLAAVSALLSHYRQVLRFYWQHRQHLDLPDFTTDEAEFMPAALAIEASPVAPAGRWLARILMLLILIVLIWAIWGRIDIIVNGQGKIIPGGYTKTLAAVEVGRVVALAAEEGKAVKAGEVLLVLDTRTAVSDQDKADHERQLAVLEAARCRAFLDAVDTDMAPVMRLPDSVSEANFRQALQHLHDQHQDFVTKKRRLDSEISSLRQSLPLISRQAGDYHQLSLNHDVSEHAWLEKEQARIEMQRQLNAALHQRAALIAEVRKTAQDTLKEAIRVAEAARQDQQKARVHGEQLQITAPIDGTVQQLSVHTVGGVVPAAQALMQVVPQQTAVEFEAFIENKDVGFVEAGQEAALKIDTFEYTKYGTVAARVSQVSRDAIEDDKKGLIYSVKVMLEHNTIQVHGKPMPLTPGMSGSVEIKTGSRRVIEYILAPLLQHGHESLHER